MLRIFSFLLRLLAFLGAGWAFVGCANPGNGPDGGAYDETPPKILKMSPALGQTGNRQKKVSIQFDEFIKVEDVANKVTISPPQQEAPDINISGKSITVQLNDTLQPNTTYTIDFSDAISDNNEGNPLGNFTYYFSTGEAIDTMEIAGNVLNAEDLEPMKGIYVGIHPASAPDSAFTSRPFLRVGRTDADGRFSIKGIAPGEYRVYALGDVDGDFAFSQKSEAIAFNGKTYLPASFPDVRHDTLWRDSVTIDTIIDRPFTHFTPDDIVLRAFKEEGQPRHFLKAQRDVPEYFKVFFTGKSPLPPVVRGLNFDAADAFVEDRSEGNDTITYWIRRKEVYRNDTLRFAFTYDDYNDSLKILEPRTDTLQLTPRLTNARRDKMEKEAREKFEKEKEKRHRKGDFTIETMPAEALSVRLSVSSTLLPNENVHITLPEPLATLRREGIHLLLGSDSVKTEAPFELDSIAGTHLIYRLRAEWRPGQHYTLRIDSAALQSLYGKVNATVSTSFSVASAEKFGALFVKLQSVSAPAMVELLQSSKVVNTTYAENGDADFFFVKPGTYYLRLFVDANRNRRWDTGDYRKGIQPEDVYYYTEPIEVRAGWDIEKTWDVTARPLTQQKPRELVKQKGERRKATAHERNIERNRQRGNGVTITDPDGAAPTSPNTRLE